MDKVAHAGLFFGFAFLWMHAWSGTSRQRTLLVLVCGVLFAAATEGLQALLPFGRTASLGDGLADGFGLLLGLAAVRLLRQHFGRAERGALEERVHKR